MSTRCSIKFSIYEDIEEKWRYGTTIAPQRDPRKAQMFKELNS